MGPYLPDITTEFAEELQRRAVVALRLPAFTDSGKRTGEIAVSARLAGPLAHLLPLSLS